MQVLFTGSESIQGMKRDTGAAYGPFYKLHYLTPFSGVMSDSRQVSGNGYIPKEISVSAEVFAQLQDCKPMTKIEILAEPDPANLNRTIVAGVRAAQ